jgi:hypothetical protein
MVGWGVDGNSAEHNFIAMRKDGVDTWRHVATFSGKNHYPDLCVTSVSEMA